jgi:hypothetical protein
MPFHTITGLKDEDSGVGPGSCRAILVLREYQAFHQRDAW